MKFTIKTILIIIFMIYLMNSLPSIRTNFKDIPIEKVD